MKILLIAIVVVSWTAWQIYVFIEYPHAFGY